MDSTARTDPRAIQRVSGPKWSELKETFLKLSATLLDVSTEANSELTTIYVKFTADEAKSIVYAVVWLKSSKRIVVGLSLPVDHTAPALGDAPQGMKYRGLTKYFSVTPDDPIPEELPDWAMLAFQTALNDS